MLPIYRIPNGQSKRGRKTKSTFIQQLGDIDTKGKFPGFYTHRLADSLKAPVLDTATLKQMSILNRSAHLLYKEKPLKDILHVQLRMDNFLKENNASIEEIFELGNPFYHPLQNAIICSKEEYIDQCWIYSAEDVFTHKNDFETFRLCLQIWRIMYDCWNLPFTYQSRAFDQFMDYTNQNAEQIRDEISELKDSKKQDDIDIYNARMEDAVAEEALHELCKKESENSERFSKLLLNNVDIDFEDLENMAVNDLSHFGLMAYLVMFVFYHYFDLYDYEIYENGTIEDRAGVDSAMIMFYGRDLKLIDPFVAELNELAQTESSSLVLTDIYSGNVHYSNKSSRLGMVFKALDLIQSFDFVTLSFHPKNLKYVEKFKHETFSQFGPVPVGDRCRLRREGGDKEWTTDFLRTPFY